MSKTKSFLGAVILGVALSLTFAAYSNYTRPVAGKVAGLAELAPGVFVTAQLRPADLTRLQASGIRSIVDLRPDGEEPGQPPATEMAEAAKANGLTFRYEPTPHGPVAPGRRLSFAKTYQEAERPMVLYCRSGSRAAHMWALTEATRADGPTADEIVRRVTAARLTVEDIRPEIESLVAQRPASTGRERELEHDRAG